MHHPVWFTKAVNIRQKRPWHLASYRSKIMLVNSEFSFKSVLFFQNVDWNKKCPSHGPCDHVLLDLFCRLLAWDVNAVFYCDSVTISSARLWKLGENSGGRDNIPLLPEGSSSPLLEEYGINLKTNVPSLTQQPFVFTSDVVSVIYITG